MSSFDLPDGERSKNPTAPAKPLSFTPCFFTQISDGEFAGSWVYMPVVTSRYGGGSAVIINAALEEAERIRSEGGTVIMFRF